ncbi:MAG TPA: Ig-like domain-containing protein [Candidatus Binataceae bacterium]|nr:Ig-like domain-containing protein [Candidatus Binataceae bacterium]
MMDGYFHTLQSACLSAFAVLIVAALAFGGTAQQASADAVAITAPAPASNVSGQVTIETSVTNQVSWTDLYIDGGYLTSGPPFGIVWNSSAVANGTHTISVKGFDRTDSVIGTDSVTISVQNGHSRQNGYPSSAINIVSPVNGSTVSGSASISTVIGQGVSWTDLYIDGSYLTSGPPFTTNWNTTAVPNGNHTISVKAFDTNDAVIGSSSVNVVVQNGAPQNGAVTIVAPANVPVCPARP